MKKILITSGGTREYIDEVRVLTNISTGKLGAMIADTIVDNFGQDDFIKNQDIEIHFVYVKGSILPNNNLVIISLPGKIPFSKKCIQLHEVTDVQSVYDTMERLVPEMDIVIHPMAISDFGFKPIDTKLKSNDPEAFIESLKDRIYQTPKILAKIKEWNPNCYLISFKFENELSNEELIKIAYDSLVKNNSDLVIANDKAEMRALNSHMSYFVTKVDNSVNIEKVDGKDNIAKEILRRINI